MFVRVAVSFCCRNQGETLRTYRQNSAVYSVAHLPFSVDLLSDRCSWPQAELEYGAFPYPPGTNMPVIGYTWISPPINAYRPTHTLSDLAGTVASTGLSTAAAV